MFPLPHNAGSTSRIPKDVREEFSVFGSWVAAIHPALTGHCTGIWGLPQEKKHISDVMSSANPRLCLGELNPSLQLNKELIQK